MGAGTAADGPGWQSLAMPKKELCLAFTLPTGQSFRWRKTGEDEYTGVIHHRVVGVYSLCLPYNHSCSSFLLCGMCNVRSSRYMELADCL